MAKKYHPDTNEEVRNAKDEKKKEEAHRKLEQQFVQISKAYQYLKDLSEQDINSLRDRTSGAEETSEGSSTSPKSQQQQRRGKVTVEEMTRQQAYEYFNNTYRRQTRDYDLDNLSTANRPRRPLYKLIPELFVGFMLLAVMMGDWTYRVYKRRQGQPI